MMEILEFVFGILVLFVLDRLPLVIARYCGIVLGHLFFFISKILILILIIVTCYLLLQRLWDFLVQSFGRVVSITKQPLICLSEWIGLFLFWFWHRFIHISCNQKRETPRRISLRLAIDKETNRVLYAVSDKDFVDILFSFLTLPMGTIIRLADKKSGLGCMENLYESVEVLDEQFLQSKACKSMLLNPRSAREVQCKNLVLKINDTEPTKMYTCSKLYCPFKTQNGKTYRLASMVENSQCSCRQAMDKEVFLEYQSQGGITYEHGVFIKETSRKFVVTDDLHITPLSMSDSLAVYRQQGVERGNDIKATTVTVDEEEVLRLLKRSLLSKTPMTDTFLMNEESTENVACSTDTSSLNEENTRNVAPFEPLRRRNHLGNRFRKMKVKLLINKSNRKVLCLQAKEDFTNLVLSFLTLPLGSIIRLLRGHSSMGSVDHLYESVGSSEMKGCFNSTASKELLLNPKLPLHFSLDEQLSIEEEEPIIYKSRRCADCFRKNMVCSGPWGEKLCFMNPKLPGQVARGGGFIKEETLLRIDDDLTIQPLCPFQGILDLDKLGVSLSNTEEHEIEVGEEEALTLLKASLISRSILNHALRERLASERPNASQYVASQSQYRPHSPGVSPPVNPSYGWLSHTFSYYFMHPNVTRLLELARYK